MASIGGILQSMRDFFVSPEYYYQILPEDTDWIFNMSPGDMWRQQPHLRTVVNFVAAQVSQLSIHTFERVSDTDRRRDHGTPIARILQQPNETTTQAELLRDLVGDLMLYDRAYWYVAESNKTPSGWVIQRLPPSWVKGRSGNAFAYSKYRVQNPNGLGYIDLDASQVLEFHGYSPDSSRDGSSPIHALKEILSEQLKAIKYRSKVWDRGGRVSSVIERPAGARWTADQRNAFRKDWKSKFAGDGPEVGGTPILEDGMKLVRMDHTAAEGQYVEAFKLGLQTVAQVYLINPTMVGLLDNANYSNVKEFRKMLYGDTLGPMLNMIIDRMNTFLLSRVGVDPVEYYLEFNIAEKLRGDFEQQAAANQSAAGAPWMTRNEIRARQNLPALPGGDELVTPLNVLIGGQASPNDTNTSLDQGDGITEVEKSRPFRSLPGERGSRSA